MATTAKFIMETAARYKDIYIKDGADDAVSRYMQDFEHNVIGAREALYIVSLTDVYIALEDGLINRKEAIKRQKEILNRQVGFSPTPIFALTTDGLAPLESILERSSVA